jgi:hypothetical protein
MLVSDYQLSQLGFGTHSPRHLRGFGDFGTPNPKGGDCPTPTWGVFGPGKEVMVRYCDCVYPVDLGGTFPVWNKRCKDASIAPWTEFAKQTIGFPSDNDLATWGTQFLRNIAGTKPASPNTQPAPQNVAPTNPSTGGGAPSVWGSGGTSTYYPTSTGGKAGMGIAIAAGVGVLALVLLRKK